MQRLCRHIRPEEGANRAIAFGRAKKMIDNFVERA
jgi:hypothetical protein